MYQKTAFQRGFTLVEVSLVLAVLGLLVGAVIGAREMSKNQANREIASDAREYRIAFEQFKIKYGYFPGDFPLATDVWGTTPAGCPGGAASGKATCNGNGNGNIYVTAFLMPTHAESFLVWTHLANAGLIAGYYAGTATGYVIPFRISVRPGLNAPLSSIDGASFMFDMIDNEQTVYDYISDTRRFPGNYLNALTFGNPYPNVGVAGGAITSHSAASIDIKYDDGSAITGNIVTRKRNSSNTCTTTNGANAVYDLTNSGASCNLIFKNTFATTPK